MQVKTKKVIEVQEWNRVVEDTYKRKYNFQQQDGCQGRGNFYLQVPDDDDDVDFENDTLPEEVNHKEMGVSFKSWLARDPKRPLKDDFEEIYIPASPKQPRDKQFTGGEQWRIDLWWERNFYPHIQMIANDLHKRGILKKGSYTINIDW